MASKKPPTILDTTFNAYTLGPILGQGGAGQVFEASDQSGSTWAIKILDPRRANNERRKRFKNEIVFSERTRHPNIVPVVDHGVVRSADGIAPFYVMPHYTSSLRPVLRSLRDPTQRLRYFDQVLSGIEAAHAAGVVHRDVKPENILYNQPSDTLVVADFGVAHFTDEELYTAVETAPDTRLANFLYAAPEQRVRGLAIDHRADIYALGLILNELFTGNVPHGTDYRTIGAVQPDYAWLDPLVASMIRQEPMRRPESIDAVKRALIAHRQDYVTRQRLEQITNSVVPISAITDALALEPPRLVDFDWVQGRLTLILNRAVNDQWLTALQNMGNFTAVAGKQPHAFRFSGNKAVIQAQEHEIQDIINYFKDWLPRATAKYRQMLENDRRVAEEQQRAALRVEQEELERQQRVKNTIKI
jgi:serine/threonine protein kinase